MKDIKTIFEEETRNYLHTQFGDEKKIRAYIRRMLSKHIETVALDIIGVSVSSSGVYVGLDGNLPIRKAIGAVAVRTAEKLAADALKNMRVPVKELQKEIRGSYQEALAEAVRRKTWDVADSAVDVLLENEILKVDEAVIPSRARKRRK